MLYIGSRIANKIDPLLTIPINGKWRSLEGRSLPSPEPRDFSSVRELTRHDIL
jgi:hypothetical protein